jgi:hypothetical protein
MHVGTDGVYTAEVRCGYRRLRVQVAVSVPRSTTEMRLNRRRVLAIRGVAAIRSQGSRPRPSETRAQGSTRTAMLRPIARWRRRRRARPPNRRRPSCDAGALPDLPTYARRRAHFGPGRVTRRPSLSIRTPSSSSVRDRPGSRIVSDGCRRLCWPTSTESLMRVVTSVAAAGLPARVSARAAARREYAQLPPSGGVRHYPSSRIVADSQPLDSFDNRRVAVLLTAAVDRSRNHGISHRIDCRKPLILAALNDAPTNPPALDETRMRHGGKPRDRVVQDRLDIHCGSMYSASMLGPPCPVDSAAAFPFCPGDGPGQRRRPPVR